MKVLLWCNRVPPAVDGVGDYTFHLGTELTRQGVNVHVLCRKQPAYAPLPAGMTLHPLVEHWNKLSVASVSQLIRQIEPDWLGLQYVPQGFQAGGLPFFLPALLGQIKRLGVRIWITFHEVQVRAIGVRGIITALFQKRIVRALCRQADVCATSIEFYRDLLRPFHSDIRLIPVGSNIELPPLAAAARSRMRQRLFPDTPLVISTFGQRDHAALIAAVHRIRKNGTNAGLLICGKIPERIAAPQPRFIRYTGYLPATEIGIYLQCSDLFMLPDFVSKKGLGGACTKSGSLAAAYAAGLPVIGVQGDMNNGLLKHGENIWLIPGGHSESIAEGIETLVTNPDLREKLHAGASNLFREHLAWPQIAEGYMGMLYASKYAQAPV